MKNKICFSPKKKRKNKRCLIWLVTKKISSDPRILSFFLILLYYLFYIFIITCMLLLLLVSVNYLLCILQKKTNKSFIITLHNYIVRCSWEDNIYISWLLCIFREDWNWIRNGQVLLAYWECKIKCSLNLLGWNNWFLSSQCPLEMNNFTHTTCFIFWWSIC